MTSRQSPARHATTGILLVLLGLFVISGAAALIYEVVWFHLLRLSIGSTTVSLGILLAAFMGGLFIGSLFYHRVVAATVHPLKAYALLELGIALCGIAVPLLMPTVTGLYIAAADNTAVDLVLRSVVCAVMLLPPTILMGATLPAIARWMKLTSIGYSRIGMFYSANIAGAVIGAMLAGFYLLPMFDVYTASAVAVGLNVLIAICGYVLARRYPPRAAGVESAAPDPGHAAVYWVIGLSGFTALGAQVVWTRLLSLLLGATVYAFSVILAVFLAGLGIGGVLGAWLCRQHRDPQRLLLISQLLLVACIPLTAYLLTAVLPGLHLIDNPQTWSWHVLDDVLRVAVVLLPATLLWGASFPLAVAATRPASEDAGETVGQVYAANTLGAIAGALGFSIVFIALLGSTNAQWLLTACAGLSAAVLLPAVIGPRVAGVARRNVMMAAAMIAVVLGGVGVGALIPALDPELVKYGRQVFRWDDPHVTLHLSEGRNASVAVSRNLDDDYKSLHINGKVVASTWPEDMRLQRLLGHMPALLHPQPKSVLIIGFGAGVTAGSFTRYPGIERIVIVEIEPQVTAASGVHFRDENYAVLEDPRTEVIHDDARHYVTTTQEQFDLITTDPIHPWARGSATLYTQEFFTLLKSRLKPGGLITQWVPLYESSEAAVKSQVGTFFSVFPQGSAWNSEANLEGYDLVLFAGTQPLTIDARVIEQQLQRHDAVRQSLQDVGINSPVDLLRAYAGREQDLHQWLSDFEPNRDYNLRLEYLAGQALDRYEEIAIYNKMTAQLRYPEDLFRVRPDEAELLRKTFARRYNNKKQ